MKEQIKAGRQAIEKELGDAPKRQFLSPVHYGHYRVTLPLIKKYARGSLIDLGCGDMPFRPLIADRVSEYHSLDLYPRSLSVTYVGDIQNMDMIEGDTYDTAICLEVLEHVPGPFRAVQEVFRVLKPEGLFIVSVPHLSRLHDVPHDYYRFTRFGLQHLLEKSGFTVLALERRSGLFSFLGHQISTTLLGSVWSIPALKQVAWFLNSWLITRICYALDQILDRSGVFATGYSAVATKSQTRDNKGLASGKTPPT